jgi:hypothetical protein
VRLAAAARPECGRWLGERPRARNFGYHAVGEIIPSIYDVAGRPVGSPVARRHKRLFHGTFPLGRYVSQPLSKRCTSIRELRQFLSTCKYVSDEEQFNRKDYWMPPEEFEKRKTGDCDDFALWTWRQLLSMGYQARYVIGSAGRYGGGHAWVTIEKGGKHYIVEPLAWFAGETLPRLSMISYVPEGSVGWDGKRLHYFIHEKPECGVPVLQFALLVGEWMLFWVWFWLRFLCRVSLLPFLAMRRFLKKQFSPTQIREA